MYILSGFDAHIYVNVYEYEQNGNDYFLLLDIFVLSPLSLIQAYIYFCFYSCSELEQLYLWAGSIRRTSIFFTSRRPSERIFQHHLVICPC